VPFVLDYQDPWVNAWGSEVGGGVNGRVDFKSRASRWLAETLEPRAVRAASAITAVSSGTYEPILRRNPGIAPITAAIPIGTDPADFRPRPVTLDAAVALEGDPSLVHICYTGALLPLGYETLRAVLAAVRQIRDTQPSIYARLRLHFIGTSNQTVATDTLRVVPVAKDFGVDDVVREVPTRIPYSQVVELQRQASVLLAMGSTERHYTTSKIFPLLLANRPLLAIYHEASTVTDIVRRVSRPPSVRLVTYTDDARAESRVAAIAGHLVDLVQHHDWNPADLDDTGLREFFAESLAGKLADVLDKVALRNAS
jgi:hypothetical protein